jgi:chemotaxis protein CheD
MTENTILVKMAEMNVIESNEKQSLKFKTTLGSCVAVIISDKKRGIHGLAHIMLPERVRNDTVTAKYAETAIPALLRDMESKGSRKRDMRAFLVGGACMFELRNGNGIINVGKKNVDASKKILEELGISVAFEDTGGRTGRTIIFDGEKGTVSVKTLKEIVCEGQKIS